jgi:multimeric flavodoxin WrbA
MKILLISGARNPNGQTSKAADALLHGASDAGATVEQILLPTLKIERCRQCEANGWGICRTEGHCIIEDDFASVKDRIRASDLVVFATPVYYGDLAESIRGYLDRLRRTCTHETGQIGIKGKPAVGLCVAGGGGGGAPWCCVSIERALASTGFDVIDLIPARRQNLSMKIPMLEVVGRWLATYQPVR